MQITLIERIAQELSVQTKQVAAAIQLLDEGATVPFIARYRKEATGGLDDTQLRMLHERLVYLRELEERRAVILKSIAEQGKLTPDLEKAILATDNKTRLEDLYLPYKPKRRTKAQIAKEAGLEPLAEQLLADPTLVPEELALQFIDTEKNVPDVAAALEGARYILIEQFAEDAELIGQLRNYLWEQSVVTSKVIAEKEAEGAKFADYFAYQELLKQVPSHRALALFRGRKEDILQLKITLPEEHLPSEHPCEQMIAARFNIVLQGRSADQWLRETVRWAWQVKIANHLEIDLFNQLRESAEIEAIHVFARNLKDLLLAAPAGTKVTLGLDPGLRTGVKAAVVDQTGKLVAHTTIFPHPPKNAWHESIAILAKLCQTYHVNLISIGNGTASRETDKLVSELIQQYPHLKLQKIVVSEAGASVYSASELAAHEFPDLDVSYRGAVSIARRLQDPLAELVKIEPKAIGVGQYQHDVNQTRLARMLDAVVEDCVNAVGVDVNTASAPLLARVSGLNEALAKNIVEFRHQKGLFKNRKMLKEIPRFGEKTFEQAAGFLRIPHGENPLDASAVHPEAYPVVERILNQQQKNLTEVLGNSEFLRVLKPQDYADDKFGVPTITDIIVELDKPGRDPRPEFKMAIFKEDVNKLADLKLGMILEGVVTNVTNFGAFVDIGVHQDGLVHISALANKFVQDPREVVKAGDIVKVKVMEVDIARKRIGLSMRLDEAAAAKPTIKKPEAGKSNNHSTKPKAKPVQQPVFSSAMADAFARLKEKN